MLDDVEARPTQPARLFRRPQERAPEVCIMRSTDITEQRIREALEAHGIACRSVYKLPDTDDEQRILLAFDSRGNEKLSTQEILYALEGIGTNPMSINPAFQRLSSSFLHLEVAFGNAEGDHAN
ncbi:MAG: hypothetical protein GF309_11380 [Candidatus Lokiarchaeota archaeon]|nr:hypothetical protein [Candidatus Lokiarchaeota archaeon]